MIPVSFLAVCLLGTGPDEKPAAPVWRETVLVKEKDLIVRLKVLAKASLADTGWMALEFENTGGKPLTVTNASYWIRSECFDPGTGNLAVSGSLASGNTYCLFPHAWATSPVSPIVLLAGKTYRCVEQPSDYSSALLGIPPAGGWSVRGQIYLALDLKDGRDLHTAGDGGLPFAFEWRRPDEAGIKKLRDRLEALLRTPVNKAEHAYILDAYLRVAEVANVATAADLLAAADRRAEPFMGRSSVVDHIARRFAKDPLVSKYYKAKLDEGNIGVVGELRHKELWSSAYVKTLVRLYETKKQDEPLMVLHQYRNDWIKDADIVRRLSATVQRRYPQVRQDVAKLKKDQLEDWAGAVDRLAMTGDKSAITPLRGVLKDKRSFRTTRLMAIPGHSFLPPLRVCDVALDAILTLLDGSRDTAYRNADPLPGSGKRDDLDQAMAQKRDRMIAELTKRLDEQKPGGLPQE